MINDNATNKLERDTELAFQLRLDESNLNEYLSSRITLAFLRLGRLSLVGCLMHRSEVVVNVCVQLHVSRSQHRFPLVDLIGKKI